MGKIIFNGISSKDVGLEVEEFPQYIAAQKVVEAINVPGRNGDLIVDTGIYRNVPRPYKVSIATYGKMSYSQAMNRVAEWLYSPKGYARLEDSYDEDFYRLAYYPDSTTFDNIFDEGGKATIQFICKPQRYFKIGEFPVMFTSAGKIRNPSSHEARPILNVVTDNTVGTISIGEYNFEIAAGAGTNITIDCELEDAYYNGESKNNYINLNNGGFPVIDPGEQVIAFTGGIQSVEVIPRWWTV